MTDKFKKRLKILSALAIGFYAFVWGFSLIADKPYPCSLPCKDLGTKPYEGESGVAQYIPECKPFSLHLELHKPEVKVDNRFGLAYRLSLRNECCRKGLLTAGIFAGGKPSSSSNGVSFRVWGPDGKRVENEGPFPWEGALVPYQVDITELRSKGFDHGGYTIKPGETLVTSPSIFSPFKVERGGHAIEDFMKRTTDPRAKAFYRKEIEKRDAEFRKEIERLDPPQPPPGYRMLMQYQFSEPGIYRIQAVYGDVVSFDGGPTWLHTLPSLLEDLVGLTLEIFGFPVSYPGSAWYWVDAESEIIEFKVSS